MALCVRVCEHLCALAKKGEDEFHVTTCINHLYDQLQILHSTCLLCTSIIALGIFETGVSYYMFIDSVDIPVFRYLQISLFLEYYL